MKVLAGQLTEVRFAWPTSKSPTDDEAAMDRGHGDDDDDDEVRPMYETSRTVLETDGICHINGSYIIIAYCVQWGNKSQNFRGGGGKAKKMYVYSTFLPWTGTFRQFRRTIRVLGGSAPPAPLILPVPMYVCSE